MIGRTGRIGFLSGLAKLKGVLLVHLKVGWCEAIAEFFLVVNMYNIIDLRSGEIIYCHSLCVCYEM